MLQKATDMHVNAHSTSLRSAPMLSPPSIPHIPHIPHIARVPSHSRQQHVPQTQRQIPVHAQPRRQATTLANVYAEGTFQDAAVPYHDSRTLGPMDAQAGLMDDMWQGFMHNYQLVDNGPYMLNGGSEYHWFVLRILFYRLIYTSNSHTILYSVYTYILWTLWCW